MSNLLYCLAADESLKIAEDLMNEAERSVKTNPETATEYEALLPVIAGYAKIGSQGLLIYSRPSFSNRTR